MQTTTLGALIVCNIVFSTCTKDLSGVMVLARGAVCPTYLCNFEARDEVVNITGECVRVGKFPNSQEEALHDPG